MGPDNQNKLFPNDPPPSFLDRLLEDIHDWCKGRLWWARIPIVIFLIYLGFKYVFALRYWSIFDPINLAFHEMGHLLFRSLGQFMHVIGGTFLQLLIPIVAVIMFLKQRDYFAVFFAFGWLASNLFYVSVYMGDARARALPLVTVGESNYVIHDWHWLLSKFGLLQFDTALAFMVKILAILIMLFSILGSIWVLWLMVKSERNQSQLPYYATTFKIRTPKLFPFEFTIQVQKRSSTFLYMDLSASL